jgi:hypothetical protein
MYNLIKIVNLLFKRFNLKLIRTSDYFDWMGKTYHLPMKVYLSSDEYFTLLDCFENELPIQFKNEEEARFFLNVLDVAVNPHKGI